jgi:hypothetical protein
VNGADKWTDKLKTIDVDRVYRFIAQLLPRRLIYWCAMRVGIYATANKYAGEEVPALLFMEALKRWDENGNGAHE